VIISYHPGRSDPWRCQCKFFKLFGSEELVDDQTCWHIKYLQSAVTPDNEEPASDDPELQGSEPAPTELEEGDDMLKEDEATALTVCITLSKQFQQITANASASKCSI